MTQLTQIYREALRDAPEKPAVIIGDQSSSYRELDERARAYARALTGLGVTRGDRVGLLMPNCLELLYCYFGCFQLGAIAVPTSLYSKAPEIIYEATHCQAKLYLVHSDLAGSLRGVPDAVPTLRGAYEVSGGAPSELPSFNQQLDLFGRTPLPEIEPPDASSPAAIFYTSGSTGRPKGVTHSHGSLFHAAENRCRTLRHSSDDSFLTTSFLCHGAAPSIVLFPMLLVGGTAHFLDHYSPQRFLDTLVRHRVRCAAAGPGQWEELLALCTPACPDLSALRYATSGGSVVPQRLQEDFLAATGVPLTASLGMTECGGYVTTPPEEDRVAGSLGRPIHDTDVRLVDVDGSDVAPGEMGEILVRSSSMMLGYWNDPEHTDRSLRDGWFATGDIARRDDAGFLYFCGRKKETIIVDGGNVTPGEVEDVLNGHPAIAQCVVVGVPDERAGQAVFAFVRLRDGATEPSKADLTAYAAERLADRKVPKHWSFAATFAVRGIAGKIDRSELAREALALVTDGGHTSEDNG